ncbi:1-deoxy-D-xylulose-5-phosphate reductoisomerase [Alicyclobacillus tolerans]|uniref:1-deoxy-D-xylulose-5-phosphate reductoisomerase n=1 Tax=Alicyclobacillus tolerans TaxID=90970 RepID=UPI001F005108|nr:1-deoxy-D-xylulose-5-phosphate reductoisomerase [Alicyclobacillus tolerans]MCF8564785.1 1-deoxy-D-xylulose-5-phosphate reductoisomerase [Alicyclobacillus tolerans]
MGRSITILGSTGVIGKLTLQVLQELGEAFSVESLAAGRNARELAEQIIRFRPGYVSVQDEHTREELLGYLRGTGPIPDIGIGDEGLVNAGRIPSDVVVSAVVGARGLLPTWAALERGATIALANKETLVAAGDLVMPKARDCRAQIVPVDSEHSALHQSLRAGQPEAVQRYVLTASGGPFRTWTQQQLEQVTVQDALKHPNWVMGQKITVDSASLMNKGLEVIEAHHLFAAPYDKIDVVVHPQSIVHSLVEFQDGSMVAQMATPDMRLPIQYALTYPKRSAAPWPRLDLIAAGELSFESPDVQKFPSLRLAYEAGRAGGFAPCVLNAANEVAVEGFLNGRISFLGMAKLVESVLEKHPAGVPRSVDEILAMDAWSREASRAILEKGGWRA